MQNITQLTELTEKEISNIEGAGAAVEIIGGVGMIGAALTAVPATLPAGLFLDGVAAGALLVYGWAEIPSKPPTPAPTPGAYYYYYYYEGSDPMWC